MGYSTAEVTKITDPAKAPKATSGGTPTITATRELMLSHWFKDSLVIPTDIQNTT
ncbi:hypothetical protein DZ08F97_07190 [Escherichia coli]